MARENAGETEKGRRRESYRARARACVYVCLYLCAYAPRIRERKRRVKRSERQRAERKKGEREAITRRDLGLRETSRLSPLSISIHPSIHLSIQPSISHSLFLYRSNASSLRFARAGFRIGGRLSRLCTSRLPAQTNGKSFTAQPDPSTLSSPNCTLCARCGHSMFSSGTLFHEALVATSSSSYERFYEAVGLSLFPQRGGGGRGSARRGGQGREGTRVTGEEIEGGGGVGLGKGRGIKSAE